ncbi:sigma-54-dependent Fis family transcriptional regulator [Bdellovibrio bacteriovorus]|uniref:NtrC family transcriptional regulator n=1 Tax=Bdellovibrio bacteriovorus TaxID=959 RepID=A0A150WBJ2_BDEBC|nr:sigma-54 dependent transcriptional regulator [Bdellovibrio bacteriovorus]KYG60337.1 NtrC family transcriptional regulator [Bdellovibrio bacteriovorus]
MSTTMESQVIAHSPRFLKIIEIAKKVSASSANVLITGESGTGKEIIARMIHDLSPRRKEPFVPINCSAIPEQLLESELFGYAKGAFTGASNQKPGLFEEANGGTLFLDEIGDLDLHLQAKLLRVLQEKKVKRVGENHYRPLNIRILAATHNDLSEDVQQKKFREDLYFRLNVVPIEVPPLRERMEDILPLAQYFLKKFSLRHHSVEKHFASDVGSYLLSHSWWGNVRELENTIERAVVLSAGNEITVNDLDGNQRRSISMESVFERLCQKEGRLLSLEEMARQYIEYALQVNKGAREKTAKDLGIDRKTLYRKTHQPHQQRA